MDRIQVPDYEVCGSHGGFTEMSSLLGYYAVSTCNYLPFDTA